MTIQVQVQVTDGGYRIGGDWDEARKANAFLAHLAARAFSPATIRAYAFDVVNLARFLAQQGTGLTGVTPADIFGWVDWQGARRDGLVMRQCQNGCQRQPDPEAADDLRRRVPI